MSWPDDPYLSRSEPGLDRECRKAGRLILTPANGRFGSLRVTYTSDSVGAVFDKSKQRIVVLQENQAKVGPLHFRLPWSNAGIKRAVTLAITRTLSNAPLTLLSQQGQPLQIR